MNTVTQPTNPEPESDNPIPEYEDLNIETIIIYEQNDHNDPKHNIDPQDDPLRIISNTALTNSEIDEIRKVIIQNIDCSICVSKPKPIRYTFPVKTHLAAIVGREAERTITKYFKKN